MAMPYHCIKRCGSVLVAARGSSIDSFNPEDGSLLSTWKCPCPSAQEGNNKEPNIAYPSTGTLSTALDTQKPELSIDVVLESSPPTKRRKLSTVEDDAQKPPAKNGAKKEQKSAKKGNRRSDAIVSGLETAAVIALAATEEGRHVIAVTGEDKSIRVFETTVDDDGKQCLKQLSQRIMPKRPCAIALTADESTIISADKFGDVYSLPLLVSETTDLESIRTTTPTPEPLSTKPFVSAANHLTVHSQRNRKALENQKKQSNKATEQLGPMFEHKLLLGHVSMLTDLALVTNPEGRNYILTADRDEHIRVSRGIPQAHIIEGFCLGHTEFISRLCIPKERPEVLLSGGGDDTLFVWDWASESVACKLDFSSHVGVLLYEIHEQDLEEGMIEPFKLAVSGIAHARQSGRYGIEDLIIVSCEGIPAVFTFLLTSQNRLEFIQTLKLPGNVLDVAVEAAGGLVLAVDTVHKLASTTQRKDAATESVTPLHKFIFESRKLVPSTIKFEVPKADDGMKDAGRLTNLLYSLENLRKRDDGREED